MNAYELADKLENYFDSDYDEIVTMLRQQADRIVELEKELHMIERHYDHLNHSVKQLSDEEIDKLAEYHGIDSLYETGRIDFAKAIIKEITE